MVRRLKNVLIDGKESDITIENGMIVSLEKTNEPGEDMGGLWAFPGLIDIHSHGALGMCVNEGYLEELSDYQSTQGVTAWFPTTTTASTEELSRVTHLPTEFSHGARIMGFHLEGPYVNPTKSGAQDPGNIREPSLADFANYANVKLITLAPEMPGADEFIRHCGCRTVIGHSEADYDTALSAIRLGANCLTHTFNAMTPLHHREPGIIGAAIDGDAWAQVICDGFHVHPSIVKMLYRSFGKKMIVISDSVKPAYLPDGRYFHDGHETIMKDGQCRLLSGTIAGSTHSALYGVQKLISWGIPVKDAFYAASGAPAAYAGLEKKGALAVGYDADVILTDGKWQLERTIIGGEDEYVCGH